MPNNPFNSDYGGAHPTRVNIAPAVVPQAVKIAQAQPRVAESPPGIAEAAGFKIEPIPTVSGKPKRVIIRGKVTRD